MFCACTSWRFETMSDSTPRYDTSPTAITGYPSGTQDRTWAAAASKTLGVNWDNLSRDQIVKLTQTETGRVRSPSSLDAFVYSNRSSYLDAAAVGVTLLGGSHARWVANMDVWVSNPLLPGSARAITLGHKVFTNPGTGNTYDAALLSHEYVHTLQEENGGLISGGIYGTDALVAAVKGLEATGPGNRTEAIGYLWQEWMVTYQTFGEKPSWCYFTPTSGRETWAC